MLMEGKNALKNQKYFVDARPEDPYFIGWSIKVKNDKSKARYTLCHEWIKWFECELNDLIRFDVDYVQVVCLLPRDFSFLFVDVLLWVLVTHFCYYFKFWNFSQIFVEIYLWFDVFLLLTYLYRKSVRISRTRFS